MNTTAVRLNRIAFERAIRSAHDGLEGPAIARRSNYFPSLGPISFGFQILELHNALTRGSFGQRILGQRILGQKIALRSAICAIWPAFDHSRN